MLRSANDKSPIANEQGYLLIEAMLAVAGIVIVITMIYGAVGDISSKFTSKTIGDHLAKVIEAADSYAEANFATLIASCTASNSYEIPFNDLITDGFLPSTFNSTNGWGQTYRIFTLEPSTDNLQVVIITTGGRDDTVSDFDFANLQVPEAALYAGAEGGFVPSGILTGESNAQLKGALGGWTFTFASTDIPNPGTGHLGGMLYKSSSNVDANDYLHRVSVSGSPELNEMTTDLGMAGNNINMGVGDVGGGDTEGLGSLNFEDQSEGTYACGSGDDSEGRVYFDNDQGLLICRDGSLFLLLDTGNSGLFKGGAMVYHGSTVDQPDCPTSAPYPKIRFAAAMGSEDNIFRPIQAFQPYAVASGGIWTVYYRIMANGAWMYPNSNYGRVKATITCEAAP